MADKSNKTVLGLFSYGGVAEGTVDCVLAELSKASQDQRYVMYHRISGDALIERSRSRALGKFMKETDADCMVMIDHDIAWNAGSMLHIADEAVKNRALVGGLYCKRAFKRGWSSRVPVNGKIEFGKPGLIQTPALATGFLAIPREVAAGIQAKLDITQPYFQKCWKDLYDAGEHEKLKQLQDLSIAPIQDGAYRRVEWTYYDWFRCVRAESSIPGFSQLLSEDWSLALRANHCGYNSYLSTYPLLLHFGEHAYSVADGQDDQDLAAEQSGNGTSATATA